jgi:hypothetical protein
MVVQSALFSQPQLPLLSHTLVPEPQGLPTFVGVYTGLPVLSQLFEVHVLLSVGTLVVSTMIVYPPAPSHTARWQLPATWYSVAVVVFPGYGPQTLFVQARTSQLSAVFFAKQSRLSLHCTQALAPLQ